MNSAYIKLSRFTRGCANEVKEALNDLESKSEFDNIILDLRGNPGGLLNESVELCNLFISKNQTVVSTKKVEIVTGIKSTKQKKTLSILKNL